MDSNFGSSSGLVRVLAAIAAVITTATLFSVVALGLTGDGGWSLLAQHVDPATPVQAAATA
jgi:hypothetical protein